MMAEGLKKKIQLMIQPFVCVCVRARVCVCVCVRAFKHQSSVNIPLIKST